MREVGGFLASGACSSPRFPCFLHEAPVLSFFRRTRWSRPALFGTLTEVLWVHGLVPRRATV